MIYECWIRGCHYIAESVYGGDLPLCVLHDHPKVHAVIELDYEPQHAWYRGYPVVLSGGPLVYREPIAAKPNAVRPVDDPMIRQVPSGVCRTIHESIDLTRD